MSNNVPYTVILLLYNVNVTESNCILFGKDLAECLDLFLKMRHDGPVYIMQPDKICWWCTRVVKSATRWSQSQAYSIYNRHNVLMARNGCVIHASMISTKFGSKIAESKQSSVSTMTIWTWAVPPGRNNHCPLLVIHDCTWSHCRWTEDNCWKCHWYPMTLHQQLRCCHGTSLPLHNSTPVEMKETVQVSCFKEIIRPQKFFTELQCLIEHYPM